MAIGQWTHVEDALCEVYLIAIGLYDQNAPPHHTAPASTAFHAVVSSDAKAQMANAAISLHFMFKGGDESEGLRQEWDVLFRRVVQRQRARNQLAHFQTLIQPREPSERQFTLRPRLMDPGLLLKYQSEKDLLVFRAHDLEQIRHSFGRLSQDIRSFTSKLNAAEAPQID
jgi:hypothetical protein